MPTVTVLTADRIMQFEAEDIVSGEIDAGGDLILSKRNGEVVNLGNVKMHSQLVGLSADDHPQYALADGTRGNFANTVQGMKADNARPNIDASINMNAGDANGTVERVTITDDGTLTDNWVNRLIYQFRDSAASPTRRTFYLNEYGEIRQAPGKHNTVAARFLVKEFADNPATARDPNVPVIELMDNRTTRTSLWGLVGDGTTVVRGIRMSYTLVLGPADPVPPGTPAGTVIVRTTT